MVLKNIPFKTFLITAVVSMHAFSSFAIDTQLVFDPKNPDVSLQEARRSIQVSELGVIVNMSDPQSVEVGQYYQAKRGIPEANMIRIAFDGSKGTIAPADFAIVKNSVDQLTRPNLQAYAITWSRPYRVGTGIEGNSITNAFAVGYNKSYGPSYTAPKYKCQETPKISYYNSTTTFPLTKKIRPTMMIFGDSAAEAKALIDRGVASDATMPIKSGYFFKTTDAGRSARFLDFSKTVKSWSPRLVMQYLDRSNPVRGSDDLAQAVDVLFYMTGKSSIGQLNNNRFINGAYVDNLTSYGGCIDDGTGQTTVRDMLRAGATGSYGTVSEPCNYTQKFPQASILVENYFLGSTLLEALAKSVSEPGEGLNVGEPMAKPFKSIISLDAGFVTLATTGIDPGAKYIFEGAVTKTGPWNTIRTNIKVSDRQVTSFTENAKNYKAFRLRKISDKFPAPSAS